MAFFLVRVLHTVPRCGYCTVPRGYCTVPVTVPRVLRAYLVLYSTRQAQVLHRFFGYCTVPDAVPVLHSTGHSTRGTAGVSGTVQYRLGPGTAQPIRVLHSTRYSTGTAQYRTQYRHFWVLHSTRRYCTQYPAVPMGTADCTVPVGTVQYPPG